MGIVEKPQEIRWVRGMNDTVNFIVYGVFRVKRLRKQYRTGQRVLVQLMKQQHFWVDGGIHQSKNGD